MTKYNELFFTRKKPLKQISIKLLIFTAESESKRMDSIEKKLPARPKMKDIPIVADDLNSILDMSIHSARLGRPPKFPNDEAGLQMLKEQSIEWLEHIRETNNDEDCENNIIPTIEAWAVWLGCSRQNLIALEKRGEDWKDTIQAFKTIISACQTQLAMRQKIPTILHIFNATNNYGYINSSEFKLVPEAPEEKRILTCDQLPQFIKNDESPTEVENA